MVDMEKLPFVYIWYCRPSRGRPCVMLLDPNPPTRYRLLRNYSDDRTFTKSSGKAQKLLSEVDSGTHWCLSRLLELSVFYNSQR
jgi:hypothetical protein